MNIPTLTPKHRTRDAAAEAARELDSHQQAIATMRRLTYGPARHYAHVLGTMRSREARRERAFIA
jgi:hypothetical protein